MEHTGKKYDCRAAITTATLATVNGEKPNLKALLAEAGIPDDRLEFAASEIQPTIFGFSQIVKFYKQIADNEEELGELVSDLFAEAIWIDDDKGDTTINASFLKEDGTVSASVSVKTKLKAD